MVVLYSSGPNWYLNSCLVLIHFWCCNERYHGKGSIDGIIGSLTLIRVAGEDGGGGVEMDSYCKLIDGLHIIGTVTSKGVNKTFEEH